jgi:hypothetical protein
MGWVLHAVPVNAPDEITITITVTKESLTKAEAFCSRVRRESGATFGYVALYTKFGEHISLPCSALMKGNLTK